ncbi:MAG: WavE lipopolysaccharide synthesis family protein [Patescibacteria group bacterium]|nr:WavE lipopolysaccharide synthesis family protein [Patescibacteria group bacterium]
MPIKKYLLELGKKIIYQAEKLSGFLFTYQLRPISAEKVKMNPVIFSVLPPCAIVMQGRILAEKNFTRETLKIYRRNFPAAIFILSTQEGENPEDLDQIKKLGVEIIINKKPAYGGIGNVNYQIILSSAGMKRAKEMGAEYALKTRTDQRFYSPSCLEYFINLQKSFPIPPGYGQKERIIGISLDTFRNRLHEISDMLVFGQIDDMLIYWNIPLETPEYAAALAAENAKVAAGKREAIKEGEFPLCEKKFTAHFLTAIGRPPIWTREDSYQTLADHFCIVDADDLDLYWHKYARLRERRHYFYDQENSGDKQELSFAEWLNIYSAFHNKN